MITIYGLFVDDRCVYVGRTKNLEVRTPPNKLRVQRLFGKIPTVRALKRVHPNRASFSEWQMIQDFKVLGQAELNRQHSSQRKTLEINQIRNLAVYKDDLEWFDGAADCADRSRIRMFRYIVAQWKAGQPVLLTTEPQQNGRRK